MDALCALLDCALGFFPCYFLFGCNRHLEKRTCAIAQLVSYNRRGRERSRPPRGQPAIKQPVLEKSSSKLFFATEKVGKGVVPGKATLSN